MLAKKCLLVGIFILFSVSLAIADPPAVNPATGEPLMIDCLRGTVTIDGDLSDWNLEAMTPAVLDAVEQLNSGQASWDNVADCSGEVYLLWDDVNIYIAAVVKDDKLSMNKTDGSIWNADCVEVFFSTLNAVAGHDEHYQYGFNANNQRWNWCNMDGAGSIEPDYLQIAATETADGYICEASIEYAQMPSLDFSAGNTIGFHPCIDDTDIDNGDTELQMAWTGLGAHDQSLGFGHMLLSADSAPEPEDPNPVGWWPLNEGAGDIAIDVSGRGNDGAISNLNGGLGLDGSVWVDDPVRGTVISFNGTAEGAFVRAGEVPQMTLTNNFTWAFWAKHSAENTADNDIILGNRMDENAADFVPRQFIKFTPTKFEWHMNGNGDDNLDYDDIAADVWLHHAVVKTADQLTYYRNGIEASSGTFTQPLDFPQPLYFGGDNENAEGENWAGLMSDVRTYNRALTELEIVAAVEGIERVDMEIGFATPVIDGEVDYAWEGASTQYFVPLDDPANASGSWKVLYDSENLYVIVDVTDDSLMNDSASSWQDDSVEIYFDGGNTKVDTPLSGDDHQYTLAWTTDEIQGTNIDGYTEGIEHAQVDTDTGWRIEVKLPWLSIQGAAPQARDLIGIDCYYNDDDDGGDSRENKLLSFSTVEGWNDASQWGTAVLASIPEPVDPGTDGLVAFYALDGDANDISGNELNGTIAGDPNFVEGPMGIALELDGVDDYVDLGNPAMLDFGTGDFTISAWVNLTTAERATVYAKGGDNSGGIRYTLAMGEGNDNRMTLTTDDDDNKRQARGYTVVNDGTWHHVVGMRKGSTSLVYVDGSEDGTLDLPEGYDLSGTTQHNALLGAIISHTDGSLEKLFAGLLDEVAIYGRALSVGEVRYLAGHLPTPVDPGTENLVAYYPLDNDANDASGNDNHGTPSGDPQWVVGAIGGALEFDGIDDHVDCGNDPSLDITGPITIAAWVYPTGSGNSNYPRIVDKSNGTGGADPGYKMYLRAADNYIVTLSAGGVFLNSTLAADLNAWNYVVFITDGTQRKLFLNGAWEEWDESTLPSSSSNPLFIGSSPAGERRFNGLIDEVEIYNRALSEPEVRFIAGER